MPRKTETYQLEEEVERIDERIDELVGEVAELDEGNPLRAQKRSEGQELERHLAGLQWAIAPPEDEPREPYEEITLGALNAGEFADVTDSLSDLQDGQTPKNGAGQIVFAAKGIVNAPFIDEDMTEEQKIAAVAQLAPQFHEWIQARVDDLSTPDVSGNGFEQRLAERESAETSR